MFTTELIVGSGASGYSLDLQTEIPISINLSIADIRSPEKRNGSYSKTIKLKGTKTNNKFFEQTYNVNVSTVTWNANIKTECYVLQGGSIVFEGYLRLMQINVMLVNGINDIEYEISIFGDNNSLFGAIGDLKLEDLDLSTYDHDYTRVNIIASWFSFIKQGGVNVAFALGNGYLYPLIDYGYNNFATNSFAVEHFRPAFYEKTYLDKIFSDAGKTYTSSFFNTDFFKKQIVPNNGEKFSMSAANLALREFYAGDTGAAAATSTPMILSGNAWTTALLTNNKTNSSLPCFFNDDTTSPFTDPSNIYNPSNGIITVPSTGNYIITATVNWEGKVTPPAGTVTIDATSLPQDVYKLVKSTDGGLTWVFANFTTIVAPVTWSTSYQSRSYNYTLPVITMYAGEQYRVHVSVLAGGSGSVIFRDGGGTPITAGTASFETRLRSTATLSFKLATPSYSPGQTVSVNDAIPKDIKQKDFLTTLFKKYNLYVDIDKDNPNNYLIETRDTFYANGSTKDWSKKLAWDKMINIKPMSELDWKTLIYRYKSDTDYYNKLYEDRQQEAYGSYKKVITNDFVTKEVKNELIFSPTPVVDNSNNSLIIPKIFSYDGTVVKPVKHNIRSLMFNGMKTMSSGTWSFLSPVSDVFGGTVVTATDYPDCGMVGDTTWSASNPISALSPTDSIEFGVPNEVFYTLGSTYTTNNLFNRFYSKQISEITDRDSKIITAYFYLEPKDISQFDFRDTIFLDMEDSGAYYYVNKIMDYNPLENQLTKVELLKIKTYDAYVPVTYPTALIDTGLGNTGMSSNRFGSSPDSTLDGAANNVMVGENISSRSSGALLSGRNINIDANAERISVVNCADVTVFGGVSGFTSLNCTGITMGASGHDIALINCSNIVLEDFVYSFVGIGLNSETITSRDNGTTRIGPLSNIKENPAVKTSSFSINPNITTYYIDCTSGDVTVTWDLSIDDQVDKTVTLIKTDATANTIYVDEVSGSPTVNGNALPYNLNANQYDSTAINNDGTNFFIK